MEKEIVHRLETFATVKSRQLTIFCEERQSLNEIIHSSHEILQDVRELCERRNLQLIGLSPSFKMNTLGSIKAKVSMPIFMWHIMPICWN